MTNSISEVLTFIWGVIFGDIQNHILQYNLSYSDSRVLKFGKYMQRKCTKDSQEAEFWILDFFRFYWFFSVLEARGGSGVIFACLSHMKIPFIAEQPLFTERRFHAVSKSYWPLKVSRQTISLLKYIEQIWSKFGIFWAFFLYFDLRCWKTCCNDEDHWVLMKFGNFVGKNRKIWEILTKIVEN